MNCKEFEHQMRSRVDRRQQAGCDDLAQHAAFCRSCRAALESYALLDEAIEKWSQVPERNSDLPQSMMSQLADVLPTAACRKRRGPAVLVTASLSVAFVVCCFVTLDSPQDRRAVVAVQRNPHRRAVVNGKGALASETTESARQLDVQPKEARPTYLMLIQETVAVIQEGPLQLPGVEPIDSGFEGMSFELVTSLSEPWAKSWKPLGEGLEDAIGHLWSPANESQ